MYIMLQIIVDHTHLVISQYAHDTANNGKAHTTTYTTIMSLRVQDLDKVSFECTGDEKQGQRELRRED